MTTPTTSSRPAKALRRAARWTVPLLLAMAVTACGEDPVTDLAGGPQTGLSFRAALAAEAERYVDLQHDRAAQVAEAEASFRATLAGDAERYVEHQRRRAAAGDATT